MNVSPTILVLIALCVLTTSFLFIENIRIAAFGSSRIRNETLKVLGRASADVEATQKARLDELQQNLTLKMNELGQKLENLLTNTLDQVANMTITTSSPAAVISNDPTTIAIKDETKPSKCYISSSGTDGIGHQMEAKFSCIATAAALNLTYVHQPLVTAEHGANASRMEQFFGLSRTVPLLGDFAVPFDASNMQINKREPLPRTGKCQEKSWFDKPCETTQPGAVWNADNCWDYFWCHLESIVPVWWKSVAPALNKAFLQSATTVAPNALSSPADTLSVVIHLRSGDAIVKADGSWIRKVVENLWRVSNKNNNTTRLQFTIHSDATHEQVVGLVNIDRTSPVFAATTIHGRDDKQVTLEHALHDMVTADLFVASESSLSHTAALLRLRKPVVIPYPRNDRRTQSKHLGWHVIKDASKENDTVWSNVLQQAWQSQTIHMNHKE